MHSGWLDEWQQLVREKVPSNNIPITLQDEIISLMISINVDVLNWMKDHESILTYQQLWLFKFCWKSDGTVDRIKTANSLIHSKYFDVHTRFVMACQYWKGWDILVFFENLHEYARRSILEEYSKETERRNAHEENVVEWVRMYTNRDLSFSHHPLAVGFVIFTGLTYLCKAVFWIIYQRNIVNLCYMMYFV